MQDRYVADVGDFGKYGLLRVLCNTTGHESGPRLRLGVVWYLFDSKEERKRKPGDGRKTGYAKQSHKARFRRRDEKLYDVLVDKPGQIGSKARRARWRIATSFFLTLTTASNPNQSARGARTVQSTSTTT